MLILLTLTQSPRDGFESLNPSGVPLGRISYDAQASIAGDNTMKLLTLLFAGSFILANGNETTDYNTAYQRAQTGDKPLLVLVTADWCAPCQTMKQSTIPELMSRDAFKNFHYATVDLSQQESLGRKLIGDRGIPQLIVFEKKNDKWERRYLRGIQTADTVEAFISHSNPTRTASNVAMGR